MAEGSVEFSLTYDLDAMQVEERPNNEVVGSVSENPILGRKSTSRRKDYDRMHLRSALRVWQTKLL